MGRKKQTKRAGPPDQMENVAGGGVTKPRYGTRSGGLRQRSTAGGRYGLRYANGARRYTSPVPKGYWDQISRPTFYKETTPAVLNLTTPVNCDFCQRPKYPCSNCHQYFHRECDLSFCLQSGGQIEVPITIDHIQAWHGYTLLKANADETNQIPMEEAQRAYNDRKNLQPLCQSCNSSKGGEVYR